MRKPKFLSPSSIMKFDDDRREWFLQYIADNKPPKIPQTKPMSIGSAFDAWVKSYIVERLFGKDYMNGQFEWQTIFELQVESHNRDWAKLHSAHAFNCYKEAGAMADLMLELEQAQGEPRMEFTVEGKIGPNEYNFLGKPDLYFINKQGRPVIRDWKVNGYCSKYAKSPTKGFVLCRDGWKGKTSRSHMTSHKECKIEIVDGVKVNIAQPFENWEYTWALQLSIYGWLLGEKIGADFIVGIEQLVCKDGNSEGTQFPEIRIASHCGMISEGFQRSIYEKAKIIWTAIESGHIFTDLSYQDNLEMIKDLEGLNATYESGNKNDAWLNKIIRDV